MVAALFALHPINVESVAWIAERKNVLSMLFFLLALGAYQWYAREAPALRPLGGGSRFLFALGLLSKPQVITFPFVLLLWDYWPLQRMITNGHESARCDRTPFPPEVFPGWCWRSSRCSHCPPLAPSSPWPPPAPTPRRSCIPVTFVSRPQSSPTLQYLGKAFWPSRLAVFYPHPGNSLRPWHVYVALFLLVAITALVFEARSRRYLLVGWLWFVGTLVPMLGLAAGGLQGHAGHRRPLRLSAVHRTVHHDLLGRSGPVGRNNSRVGVSGRAGL